MERVLPSQSVLSVATLDSPATPESVELPPPALLSARRRVGSLSGGGIPLSVVSRRIRPTTGDRDPVVVVPGSLEEARKFFDRLPPLPPGRNLTIPMTLPGTKKTRRCHGCHGLNNADHATFPLGAGRCPLNHNPACCIVLGKDSRGKEWRPCPPEYQGITEGNLENFTDDDEEYDSVSEGEKLEEKSEVSEAGDDNSPTGLGAASKKATLSSSQTPVVSSVPPASTIAEELAKLRLEREALEEQAKLQDDQKAAAEEVEMRRQLQAEKDRIAQLKGGTKPSLADSLPADFRSHYQGPNIKNIRKVTGLRGRVEQQVEIVRKKVPSLGSRQSAPRPDSLGAKSRLPKSSGTNAVDKELQEFKEFQAWKQKAMAGQRSGSDSDVSPPRQSSQNASKLAALDPVSEPSDDEDELSKPVILVYRRDKSGKKYRSYEPYLPQQDSSSSPAVAYKWVTDPTTGREYKKSVKVQPSQTQSRQFKHADHRVGTETPCTGFRRGVRSPSRPAASKSDRLPGIIPLDNKEGRSEDRKSPSVVDWARNCPVTYAEKVKFEELNLPLWVWAFVSEILASRSGLAPDMKQGELEARLQHLLCVLQVTLVNSERNDFTNKGWMIASIYAKRVQQKLDRGLENWDDFSRFGFDPHPSEMISAKTEADRKFIVKKKDSDRATGIGTGLGMGNRDKKLQCTTWNNSEVEGKCKYLADNPSATRCNRRHDCSYCLEKGHGTYMHQRRFCKKRRDVADE